MKLEEPIIVVHGQSKEGSIKSGVQYQCAFWLKSCIGGQTESFLKFVASLVKTTLREKIPTS